MQLNQIDLNLLVVFDVIYREGNLTRAAEALRVTQPTVSNALARLRQTYDDPLFIRSGRGVVPTPIAQRMIDPVRKGLRHMQQSLDSNIAFDPTTADRIYTISAGDFVSASLLPPLMQRIEQDAPHIRVHCAQLDRHDVTNALETGAIDFAIDIPDFPSTQLNRKLLWTSDHVCVLRRDHPAARKKWDLDLFLSQEHITVSSRMSGSGILELAMGRMGKRVTPKMRVQYYLTAFEIIQSTDLVLIAPRALAKKADVRIKELPFEQPSVTTWLFWHRNAEDDPANKWLRHQIGVLFEDREK